MTEIIIHGVPGSPYVRMPLLACEEKGAPYRLAPMAFGQGKTPEHLARMPFGKIPFMEHDGFWLYEVQAIIRYIDEVSGGPSLVPTDPKARARMNQVMNIMDWYVMPSISIAVVFNRLVKPQFGMTTDEAEVRAALPLAQTSLKALEDILGAKPYFAGEAVSLADLMAVAHLQLFPQTPEGADLMAGSSLLGWLERMAERPSVQATTWEKLRERVAAA